MRIALDFDGVLSDCGSLKSEHAKRMYGVDIPPERFKKELVVKELAGGAGLLTMAEYQALQDEVYGNPEVGMTMKPVEGMKLYVPRLLDEGHHLHIVTSRSGPMLDIAAEWAKLHGLDVGFTGVGHGKSKAAALEGFDLYADDDLDKLEPVVDVVPHRFLFTWGYNLHLDAADVARRVADWHELYGAIQAVQAEAPSAGENAEEEALF